jgi:alpha-tubulin suppressor-like RCC1 family protein
MVKILQRKNQQSSVIIPAIPGLTEELVFDGTNFISEELVYTRKAVSASEKNSYVLINNKIYGCGDNHDNQLTNLNPVRSNKLVLLFSGEIGNEEIISIKAGPFFCIALTSSGKVFAWGENLKNFLNLRENQEKAIFPKLVMGFENIKIVEIDCGSSHIVCRSEDGDVYTFGLNLWNCGGIGRGNTAWDIYPPTKISVPKATQVCARYFRTAIIDIDQNVYVWGIGIQGFRKIEINANKIFMGKKELIVFHEDDVSIYDLDENSSYFLDIPNSPISASVGNGFYLIVTSDKIIAHGNNENGKLGSGDDENFTTSYDDEVTVAIDNIDIEDIASGDNHTIMIDSDGRIYTWGSGMHGKLGDGEGGQDFNTPIEVFLS